MLYRLIYFVTIFHTILVLYYLDVTIVNRYGKDVKIITTHSDTRHQRFTIAVGRSYQINGTTSTNKSIFITAYDNATFIPMTINGKNSVSVVPSLTPVSRIYSVPSGELWIHFNNLCSLIAVRLSL